MSRIPQSFIDELLARSNIVEVIGARVQLKKAGREYRACCPFHTEKTASFYVSPDKQFYHCFGCGAHGTVLGFLMEHDRLPFPEAVEELAAALGLTVPHEGGAAPAPRRNDSLFDLMARVAGCYAENLSRNERARTYLQQRGLTRETIERFGIGYAPNSWNEVLRRFGGGDTGRRQLAEAGLIIERGADRSGESHYDRFRDRIMFPIRDARGRVIAFGGRIIDQGEPKYLNSPETSLFHKGRELYGLYEVRRERAPLRRLLVVEGYMDVVRLHQAGLPYAVATLGTATTAEHLKRVFQLVSEVVFSFDGDRAGRAAAWRALTNALPEAAEGRELRFLFLPEGEDPDTLVGKEGREAFEQRLSRDALPLSEYLVREVNERITARGAERLSAVAGFVKPLIEQVPEGLYRRLLAERLGQAFGFQRTPEGIAELLGVRIGSSPQAAARQGLAAGRGSLVRQAVRLLLNHPQIALQVPQELLAGLAEAEESGIEVLRELLTQLRLHPAQSTAQVLERWRDRPEAAHLARLASMEALVTDSVAAQRELASGLGRLLEESGRRRIDRLLEKDRSSGLSRDEKLELQKLTSALARPRSAGAPL
ncbi:MAG TPA: DNA primase [Steroidobacteraceae bacterium]|nr:DNA primase [Steroidobacteraceae bacterium]